MNKLAFIKSISSILLLVCFVLPLSKCATTMPVGGQVNHQAFEYHYPYKILQETTQRLFNDNTQKIDNALGVIIIIATFFMPIISFLLKPLHQSILILIASMPSAYFLTIEFLFNTPLIGLWLASLCWLTLISISLLTIWPNLLHNKLLKVARSFHSLTGRGLRRAP